MAGIDDIGRLKVIPDGVYVDSVNGVAGTTWPIGTPGMPVSNLTDALVIAAARKLRTFYLMANGAPTAYLLPSDLTQAYTFIGCQPLDEYSQVWVDLNGKDCYGSYFKNLTLTDQSGSPATSTYTIRAYNCYVESDFGGSQMVLYYCHVGTLACKGVSLFNCYMAPAPSITPTIGFIGLFACSGSCELMSLPIGTHVVHGIGLKLTLNAGCTLGTINIYGDTKVINNSGGTIVNDYTNKPNAEVPVTIDAINASETDFLNLATAGFHYTIDDLVLKCADPGANTVNVRLYKLVNGASTNTQTFAITTLNFATYFDINTMFGLKSLAGDNIQITVQATAGGPYAVTGSYAYRSA